MLSAIGTRTNEQMILFVSELPTITTQQQALLDEIAIAEQLFDMASSPHEIDAAIYRLHSAELKYKAFITLERASKINPMSFMKI